MLFLLSVLFIPYFIFCVIQASFNAGSIQLMLYLLDSESPNSLSVSIFLRCFLDCLFQRHYSFKLIKEELWLTFVRRLGTYESSTTFMSLPQDNQFN